MTHSTPTNRNTPVSPIPAETGPDPEINTRSEPRRGVSSDSMDPQHPQHPPRRKRRAWLLVVAALMIVGLGNAQWPVIDVSAVAQLVQTVRLVQDQLTEMTTAKEALLGQVANFTGTWNNLTGEAYELGERVSGTINTAKSLTDIDAALLNRRNAEQLAWPSPGAVQSAYAGADPAVITSVLTAHQTRSQQWNEQRAAWYDTQIMLASTGEFLEQIESTASTQNTTTDAGLSAQLDRQIAVASSSRDIAARQLEIAASSEHRAAQLDHIEALDRAWRQQQELNIRAEIRDAITQQQAAFDASAFDSGLYTPVLPSYGPDTP